MKSTIRLGSALILGAALMTATSLSALAQAGTSTTGTVSSTTDAPVNGVGVTRTPANANTARTQATPTQPHVGATSAKASAKIKKAQMLSRKGKTVAVKPHSAAARENGPILSSTAVVSGVSGGGVAAPTPSAPTTNTSSQGAGASGSSTNP